MIGLDFVPRRGERRSRHNLDREVSVLIDAKPADSINSALTVDSHEVHDRTDRTRGLPGNGNRIKPGKRAERIEASRYIRK